MNSRPVIDATVSRSACDAVPDRSRNLGFRVASALVLIAVGLGAAWFGGWWFAGLVSLGAVLAVREWARLTEPTASRTARISLYGCVLITAALAEAGFFLPAIWVLAGWAIGFAIAARIADTPHPRLAAAGLLYIGPAVVALLWLRAEGLAALLVVFASVWMSDSGAYLFGRLLGGPKLASAISPNKTWAGLVGALIGGALGAAIAGLVFALALLPWLVGAGALLGLIGQLGDLFESALKRRSRTKDSGALIPGHGGVLDRVDALIPASVLFAGLLMAFPQLLEAR